MSDTSPQFTAAQVAAALGKTRQAVRKLLRNVRPAGVRIVAGNEAAAWTVEKLPGRLREYLAIEAVRKNCKGDELIQRIETLLSMPRRQWRPPIPLEKIHDDCIEHANKLREALKPWLTQQHDPHLRGEQRAVCGVEDFRRFFGNRITTRYWRELFTRTLRRDNGAEEWNRIEIFLPDRLKEKNPAPKTVPAALAEDFADIQSFIAACANPHAPNETERRGVWTLALQRFTTLVNSGAPEKSAARRVRQFLFARAPFLAASRDALLKAFNRKLEALKNSNGDLKALRDGREENGNRADYPSKDIRRVRHSAVLKNGKRIDAAWREEYSKLSDYTHQRHPYSRQCPRAFYECVNREKVDTLFDRLQGKRALRRRIGGVTRNTEGLSSMARWVMDDMTSNIEVSRQNRDGTESLIQPQIIVDMDTASGFIAGCAVSDDKAPTAELVCEAFLDGVKQHGVPDQLWLENGFTFGNSLNVNGKQDEQGRTVVAGLATYGCAIHHFDPMSPTSKGELEKGFDLLQRRMERHPGYTGRNQMLDASEDFKREQRLIRSGKMPAGKYRYTFDEFPRVLRKLIAEYNDEPQFGRLRGLSPRECFEALKDPANPPIKFDNQLHWMLTNERYRVQVRAGGVTFRHYGRKIQVRGGELANLERIGAELWALMDRRDDSLVTFMSLDYRDTFTVETCQNPSADESRIASGSGLLASELGKIGEHMRAVDAEFKDLKTEFGNPRQDLLAQFRGETTTLSGVTDSTTRRTIINSRVAASAEQMTAQREAITAKRRRNTANKSKASRLDIPSVMVGDDDQSRRALELLGDAPCRPAGGVEITEGTEQ